MIAWIIGVILIFAPLVMFYVYKTEPTRKMYWLFFAVILLSTVYSIAATIAVYDSETEQETTLSQVSNEYLVQLAEIQDIVARHMSCSWRAITNNPIDSAENVIYFGYDMITCLEVLNEDVDAYIERYTY